MVGGGDAFLFLVYTNHYTLLDVIVNSLFVIRRKFYRFDLLGRYFLPFSFKNQGLSLIFAAHARGGLYKPYFLRGWLRNHTQI